MEISQPDAHMPLDGIGHRNLYPLAVAHALIGLALAVSVPDSIQRHMRVGLGYLHYH
jgi:hypothetical protein